MRHPRPYIFLDFDGVLAVYEPVLDRYMGEYVEQRNWVNARKRGKRMNSFLESIKARLIISSNWRYGVKRQGTSIEDLQKTMRYYLGVDYPIHGAVPLGVWSPYGDEGRDQLILDFVKSRRIKAPWLAFDDLKLSRIPQRHKVVTNTETGITEDDYNLAIRRLDSQL